MSDPTPQPTDLIEPAKADLETPTTPTTPTTPEKKPNKKRRWRRRLGILAIVLVVLALVARIAMTVAFPTVLNRIAGIYGLTATYDRLELSLLGADVGLWGLKFTPTEGGEPILRGDYVRARIDPTQLFVGRLYAYRVEADGVEVNVDRTADGKIPLLERFKPKATPAPAPSSAKPQSSSQQPSQIDLTPPVTLEALRVQRARARFRDASVNPPVDSVTEMDLRVSNIGTEGKPINFEVKVASDPLLDSLRVEGTAKAAGATVDADLRVLAKGLRPKAAAGYLRPFGIAPAGDSLTVRMAGHLQAWPADSAAPTTRAATPSTRPAGKAGKADALAGLLEMNDIVMLVDGREALGLDTLNIELDRVAPGELMLGKVVVRGGRANAARLQTGVLRTAGLDFGVPVDPVSGATSVVTPAAPPVAVSKPAPSTRPMIVRAPPPTTAPADVVAALSNVKLGLEELIITDVRATVTDAAVAPSVDLAAYVDELSLRYLHLNKSDQDSKITGRFRVPGVIRSIHVDGIVRPFPTRKSASMKFRAEGIRPDALRPYLNLIGVESDLNDASASADLTSNLYFTPAGIIADAWFSGLKLTDGADLFAMQDVQLSGIGINAAGSAIRIAGIDVVGPALSVRREADGTLAGLGFRYRPTVRPAPKASAAIAPVGRPSGARQSGAALASAAPDAAALAVATPSARPPAPSTNDSLNATLAALPTLEIGRLNWHGVRVTFEDRAVSPVTRVELTDTGVDLRNLLVDLDPDSPPGPPGTFKAWMSANNLAGKLTADGTFTPKAGGMAVDVAVSGEGLTAGGLSAYLSAFGIEPLIRNGSLKLNAGVAVVNNRDALNASIKVDQMRFADGATELLAVDRLNIADVALNADGVTVGLIDAQKPRVRAARDAQGALIVAGVKLPTTRPASSAPASPAPTPSAAVVMASRPATPATQPAVKPTTLPAAPAFVAVLKALTVNGAAIDWEDDAVSPIVKAHGTADLSLTGFTFGRKDAPAKLSIKASADDILKTATIDGTVLVGPDENNVSLSIAADGVKAGSLTSYLPEGIAVTLKDGRFRAGIGASVMTHAEGGHKAYLKIAKLDWRDGETSLAKVDDLTVRVARADLEGNRIAVDEISVSGVEADASKSADGSLRFAGLALGVPAPAKPAPATRPVTVAATPTTLPAVAQATTRPADAVAAQAVAPISGNARAGATPAEDPAAVMAAAARRVAEANKALPLVTLEKLNLGLKHFGFTDLSRTGSAAVTAKDVTLRNINRLEWLGPDPDGRTANRYELTGRIDPVVDSVKLTAQVAAFARQPTLQAEFSATGVSGDGLLAVAPELKPMLDASQLKAGVAKGKLETQIKFDRRTPFEFDLSNGFDADFLLSGMEFRPGPDDPVAAGLEEIRSEGIKVRPKTGEVRIKAIEITKPTFYAWRDKEGIHTAGLMYRLPVGPTTQPTTLPSTQPAASPATQPVIAAATSQPATASPTTAPAVATAAPPAGEVRIDKLLISGADIRIEDRSVDPVFILPINGLEVEAKDFSTLAFTQDLPLRFNVIVNAGKVSVPKPVKGGGVIGAIGDVGLLVGGASKEPAPATREFEDRELFSQVAASGRVGLYPTYNGWAKASVNGFELAAVKGLAIQNAGVDLSGGTFDASADVRFKSAGDLDAKLKAIFTDLKVKDSPDGLIARQLVLPGPLDTGIFLVQAADGSITFPIEVPMEQSKIAWGPVFGSAVNAVGGIMAKAMAAAPVKAVTAITDTIGLGGLLGGDKKPKVQEPVVFTFPAGSAAIEPQQQAMIGDLVQRAMADPTLQLTIRHDMGTGDVELARARANLRPEDAAGMAQQLRNKKLDLQRRRSDLAGRARAQIAAGVPAESSATLDRLHTLDRELAQTEDALDQVFELLRPGAERQADRRTRAASLDIARERLETVRAAIAASGGPQMKSSVKVMNPEFKPDTDPNGKVTVQLAPIKE